MFDFFFFDSAENGLSKSSIPKLIKRGIISVATEAALIVNQYNDMKAVSA